MPKNYLKIKKVQELSRGRSYVLTVEAKTDEGWRECVFTASTMFTKRLVGEDEYLFSLSDFNLDDEDLQETIRRNQDLISVTLTGREYSELSVFAEAVRLVRDAVGLFRDMEEECPCGLDTWIQRAQACLSTITEAHEDESTDEEVDEGDTTPV